jgi:hypothetical protein
MGAARAKRQNTVMLLERRRTALPSKMPLTIVLTASAFVGLVAALQFHAIFIRRLDDRVEACWPPAHCVEGKCFLPNPPPRHDRLQIQLGKRNHAALTPASLYRDFRTGLETFLSETHLKP